MEAVKAFLIIKMYLDKPVPFRLICTTDMKKSKEENK